MTKIMEKVKNFCGTVLMKAKHLDKKKETKAQPEEPKQEQEAEAQPEESQPEQKPEE
ncbi:MAG: hypothetical protein K9L95_06165 [Candidatus Omnitrophica bacterium]|nr:hypothetical protein [Candidatus Omnitrophota bacterium]